MNRTTYSTAGRLLALGVVTTLAISVQALPPAGHSGETVQSIPRADQITRWQPLDNQRVLVNLSSHNSYVLTLKHQCHGLSWARDVSVTMSNNTIWAGFDAIKADGLQCPIDRITRVSAKERLNLQTR